MAVVVQFIKDVDNTVIIHLNEQNHSWRRPKTVIIGQFDRAPFGPVIGVGTDYVGSEVVIHQALDHLDDLTAQFLVGK